jgi:two-component system, NtrC family, nitrogen regulation sensor histidine kinase NtrY
MKLRWTLLLAFTVLALVPLALVVPLASRNLTTLLREQHAAKVEQAKQATTAQVRLIVSDVRRSLDDLAASSAMEDVVRDAAAIAPPAHVTRAAAALMGARGLKVLALLDESGRTLSSGHLPARLNEPDDPLFAATLHAGVSTALVEVQGASGLESKTVLVAAKRLDAADRGVWAVGGQVLDDSAAEAFAQLSGAAVELTTTKGTVGHAGQRLRPDSSLEVPLAGDVHVRLHVSRADAAATRAEVLRAVVSFAILGLGLAIVVAAVVARRLTRPIEALTEAATRIGQGAVGVPVPEPKPAELQQLAQAFNRMTVELKSATDQLLAAERVAAWQEVARRLAHEIKNPLTPIRMSLETLLAANAKGLPSERFAPLLNQGATAMLEEVARLTRIVDEFSHFARLPKPVRVPLDLAEATRAVMHLYTARGALRYEVEAPGPAFVSGDRDQLTQVLVNLVKNAEEAMGTEGGLVRVEVLQQGNTVCLTVTDQGPGIPAELKGRLFEPYVTTKKEGTGLGLSIAARIAQEHDGRLEASNANPGARIELTLPSLATPSER